MIKKIFFNRQLFENFNFYTFSVSLFLISLLFSGFYFQIDYLFNIKVALFDVLALLYLPFLILNYKIIRFKKFSFFLFIFLAYVFFNLLSEIIFLDKSFTNYLFKKKIFLFIQLCRSVVIFYIVYIFVYKIKIKNCSILLTNIFSIYSVFIIILFAIDSYFVLEKIGHIYINDIQRASENIRLKGFFDDPNFLSVFACFFVSIAIYLNLSFFHICLYSIVIILTGSKTGFIYLLFLFFIYLFLLRPFQMKNHFENFFKSLFYIAVIGYTLLIAFDLTAIAYIEEYVPKSRYYLFLDFFEHNRFIMWKDFLSQEVNIFFGNGIYELTNYSKLKYNNFSHNSFLDIYYDFGLIGIVLLFLFYFSLFRFQILKLFYKNFVFINLSFNLLVFVFFMNYTLFYLPFIWFFLPIIISIFENKN